MPTVQFGTYKLKGTESFEATLSALQQGYKGIDTATCYDNEKQVKDIIVEVPLKCKAPQYSRLGKLSQLVVLEGRTCLFRPNCGEVILEWIPSLRSQGIILELI